MDKYFQEAENMGWDSLDETQAGNRLRTHLYGNEGWSQKSLRQKAESKEMILIDIIYHINLKSRREKRSQLQLHS